MTRYVLSTLALCLLSVVLLRAGLTRALVDDLLANKQKRAEQGPPKAASKAQKKAKAEMKAAAILGRSKGEVKAVIKKQSAGKKGRPAK